MGKGEGNSEGGEEVLVEQVSEAEEPLLVLPSSGDGQDKSRS